MPYNTTAIPPRREPTGHTQLPLSRVKKIIALDNDIHMCSNNAAFVITLATELFIQYLAEQAHNVVKSERKPRRNIQYRDLSSAVSRHDNLEFLSDVVPRTVPYKQVKEKKASASAGTSTTPGANGEPAAVGAGVEPGQTTLDGKKLPLNSANAAVTNGTGINGLGTNELNSSPRAQGHPRQSGVSDILVVDGPNAQLHMEIRDARTHGPGGVNGQQGDVEMS